MVLYVGDGVGLMAVVTHPFTKEPLSEGIGVTVDFYAPAKDPVGTPADRELPDVPDVALAYDPNAVTRKVTGAWVVFQDTSDAPWAAGRWSFRITVSGAYENVEFGSFTLRE